MDQSSRMELWNQSPPKIYSEWRYAENQNKDRKENNHTQAHRDLMWFGLIPTSTERREIFILVARKYYTSGGENTTISLSLFPYPDHPEVILGFQKETFLQKHKPQ